MYIREIKNELDGKDLVREKEANQNKLTVNIVWKNRINFQCG